MTVVSVKQALSGKLEAGTKVTVRGWVRTRRDSKAGLSFVNVTDGSCFDPIQAVVSATLGNYETEVKHLTSGAGVIVTGILVPSQGKGQSFELQADDIDQFMILALADGYITMDSPDRPEFTVEPGQGPIVVNFRMVRAAF